MIRPKEKNADGKIYSPIEGTELIIVKKENRYIYMVFENKELKDLEIENCNELPVGTRFAGKVDSLSPQINAAYILMPDKNRAFLKNAPKDLKCESVIPVEIKRSSSKGKLASVSITDDDIEHKTVFSIISYGKRTFEKLFGEYSFERVLTDEDKLYSEIIQYNSANESMDETKIILYRDSMVSLGVLYSVTKRLEESTSKTIWLKSGANIFIENTNAFTVIDVNSAKNDKKGENSYLKINKEAAREIFRQMNIRNLSGIILVDFINMTGEEEKDLLDYMNILCKDQKKYTKVVDITPLGIAEITRKKEGPTLGDICI